MMYHGFGKSGLSYDLWTFCGGVPRFHVEASHGGKVWTIQCFEDEDKLHGVTLRLFLSPFFFFFWGSLLQCGDVEPTSGPRSNKQGYGVSLRQHALRTTLRLMTTLVRNRH